MSRNLSPLYAAQVPDDLPATPWRFPPPAQADTSGLAGIGADLAPATIISAYRQGLFPMPLEAGGPIGWWSPDPRGVLPLSSLHVSRSLRRSSGRFDVRVNTDFESVIAACADPSRDHGWIDDQIRAAYIELHRLGWVHSVEAWRDGQLVGGLYGVAVGGLFAGESMFHRETDASKAALVALVDLLSDGVGRLIDVQWRTDHLASLGVEEWPRSKYIAALPELISAEPAAAFASAEPTL